MRWPRRKLFDELDMMSVLLLGCLWSRGGCDESVMLVSCVREADVLLAIVFTVMGHSRRRDVGLGVFVAETRVVRAGYVVDLNVWGGGGLLVVADDPGGQGGCQLAGYLR